MIGHRTIVKGKYPGCIISLCSEEGGKRERYVTVHDREIKYKNKRGVRRQAVLKEESVIKRDIWLMRDGERGRLHPLSHLFTQNYTPRVPGGKSR